MLKDARERSVRYAVNAASESSSEPRWTSARFEKNESTLWKNERNESPSAADGATAPEFYSSGQKSGTVSASVRGSETRLETMITTASSSVSFQTERTTCGGTLITVPCSRSSTSSSSLNCSAPSATK